jgi:CBS domain-containing protein
MTVLEIMTNAPACATPETPLQEAAHMMIDNNCGMLPVIDETGAPIGVITDRDIVCRTVALARNPLELFVRDAMTNDVVTVTPECTATEASEIMENMKIRRIVVVDDNCAVVGVVAQADLARRSEILGGEIVAAVSQPSIRPSEVH